ncbi:Hypothetical predicted protein [Paramuricea clavata]|uniref:Uncharacterized protein n=1 Tax=Paramuricea clavata TaxID=317549 RepID=A0A6S7KFY2_PARCT|nr:Hypothetical predicted protein [Paramuricea clavata]
MFLDVAGQHGADAAGGVPGEQDGFGSRALTGVDVVDMAEGYVAWLEQIVSGSKKLINVNATESVVGLNRRGVVFDSFFPIADANVLFSYLLNLLLHQYKDN